MVQPKDTAGSEWDKLEYQNGFGNHFETESIPGALPVGKNNP